MPRVPCAPLPPRSLVKDSVQLCTVRSREATTLLILSKEVFDAYAKPAHTASIRHTLTRAVAQDVVPLLKPVPFFSHLSPRDLALLASLFGIVSAARGDLVCREGEPGSSFFFLLEGAVQVVAEGEARPSRLYSCLLP